ncbi:MAG: DUF1800 domain-containing protein, partial [Burkholderiaceae bacterium]|nr:DUF1800 domain-containing protein [Burkholderiaceae bacterium]
DSNRFVLQAQGFATDADIAIVRARGYAAWLTDQLNAPPSTTGWDWLNSRGYGEISATTRYFDNSYPGDYMIWNQLMTSPDMVRKRFALALSEFFVVGLSGLNFAWRSHGIAAWWDLLVANAFGSYRQLLQDVTLNTAMGYYLNTKGNQKENTTGRLPDENYAREVMQLFTIGLYQLNLDGTEKRDARGQRLESYTQSDVTNLARVFTGWDLDLSQNVNTVVAEINRTIPNTTGARLPMTLTASRHSTLASTFLGTTIAAGTDGVAALRTALDTLFSHPNVGPFFGRQMIQRLVTSNPSPAYVGRVAAAFNNNGAGVRGDLKAVLRAILLDDEARAPSGLTASGFGRLREPMLRLVQWGRSFGIRSNFGSWKIGDLSNPATQLGQSPLRSPSVFNFFRPGYVPPSTSLAANQSVAPEFQLVNESSVGGYLNYMQNVILRGIYVNGPDQSANGSTTSNGYDITASYAAELALVTDAAALVNRVALLLTAGQLSESNRTLIVTALNATPVTASSTDTVKLNRVAAAVLMVMASADYLVQK